MKKTFMFLSIAAACMAYEAKVQPFEIYKIKAAVSGTVVKSEKTLEAKNIKDKIIVKIDDRQNKIDLKNLKLQYEILKKEIENQRQIVKRKKSIYEKYKNLKTKSKMEKDLKFYDYINALNQLLNLKSQLDSTSANIDKIKDIINKKNIKADGYVYKIYVNKNDYVAPGVLVAEVDDVSKQKLTVYVPIEDINSIKNKNVYINGKKSSFKIYKIWNVPDTQYITSYKVELVGNGLKFGKIVKVEFR
jgi:multidrug resistance efflux pump